LSELPYLTRDLPGIGGSIKNHDADFIVEELPLYEPCGEGTHVYIRIEKRGLTTHEAVRRIARALGKTPRDVGYAGLKDARGITRQTLSVEHVDPGRVSMLDIPSLTIQSVSRHKNKLKIGHLRGNGFLLKVRDHAADALPRAQSILNVLRKRGLPNYFGAQRFGRRGLNAAIGAAIMRGAYEDAIALILGGPSENDMPAARSARVLFEAGRYAEAADAWPHGFGDEARLCRAVAKSGGPTARAWRQLDVNIRSLYLSALQSELFNRVLANRIDGIDRVETGDMAYKHANGACFAVENAELEQPRCEAFEISPTGPIFGARMTRATGEPGEREAKVLEEAGVTFDQRRSPDGIQIDGARRPLRVPIHDTSVQDGRDEHGPYIEFAFNLPSGAYATTALRELCKNENLTE
jgi:tRNA pseudouridine13 synthase